MNLIEQRAASFKAAQDILDIAAREHRDVTPAEARRCEDHITVTKALDERIARAKTFKSQFDELGRIGPDEEAPGSRSGLFTAEQKAGFIRAARSKGSYGATVSVKTPTLGGSLLPTSGTMVSDAPRGGAVALRGLFTQATAEGPTVRYYVLGPATAAVVAEGAAKPDAGVTTTAVDASLLKLAATFKVSDELQEDAEFLVASITRSVLTGISVKENTEIVAALGGASGILTGSGAAATALDIIAEEVGAQEALHGLTPGALVVNPIDLSTIRKAKATTAGSYFVDPLSAAPSAVHGVPIVSTAATPAGTMYLVSDGAGVFYSRGALRVEAGYDSDDWIKNLMTVRVEERVLPAIVRPELVTVITLT